MRWCLVSYWMSRPAKEKYLRRWNEAVCCKEGLNGENVQDSGSYIDISLPQRWHYYNYKLSRIWLYDVVLNQESLMDLVLPSLIWLYKSYALRQVSSLRSGIFFLVRRMMRCRERGRVWSDAITCTSRVYHGLNCLVFYKLWPPRQIHDSRRFYEFQFKLQPLG